MADAKLVESILESYRRVGGINHLDGVNLPSREAVAEIIRDLLRLVFPGYYDRTALHSDKAPFFVSQMLISVAERLRQVPGIEGTETTIVLKTQIDRPITFPTPRPLKRARERSP